MTIDTSYITSAVHGSANDIRLKNEFDALVDEFGWWVVLRVMDLSKHSSYWNEELKEAPNGPAWEYTDYLVKARRVEIQRLTSEEMQKFGVQYNLGKIFYLKSNLTPKREDVIYSITTRLNPTVTAPQNVFAAEGFNIEEIERKIEHGLVYNKCYCSYNVPRNNESIEGGFIVNNIIR